ncbi:hypothetical protein MTO96_023969 [Rhipicephalus appendiculatus]
MKHSFRTADGLANPSYEADPHTGVRRTSCGSTDKSGEEEENGAVVWRRATLRCAGVPASMTAREDSKEREGRMRRVKSESGRRRSGSGLIGRHETRSARLPRGEELCRPSSAPGEGCCSFHFPTALFPLHPPPLQEGGYENRRRWRVIPCRHSNGLAMLEFGSSRVLRHASAKGRTPFASLGMLHHALSRRVRGTSFSDAIVAHLFLA